MFAGKNSNKNLDKKPFKFSCNKHPDFQQGKNNIKHRYSYKLGF